MMAEIQAVRSLKIQEEKHWPEKGIKLYRIKPRSQQTEIKRAWWSAYSKKKWRLTLSPWLLLPGVPSMLVLSLVACKPSEDEQTNSFLLISSCPYPTCCMSLSKHGKGCLNKTTLRGRVTSWAQFSCSQTHLSNIALKVLPESDEIQCFWKLTYINTSFNYSTK